MITPGYHNFSAYRWATLRKTFVWRPGGVLANLTGYTARATFRVTPEANDIAMELTDALGGTIIAPLAGSVTMYVPMTDLELLTQEKYYYSLQLIEPGGDVLSFVEGIMTLKKSWLK